MIRGALLVITMLYLTSCSTMNKVSVSMASPLLFDLSYNIETETDYEHFKKATPSNLQLFEAIWSIDKNNHRLLSVLVKGYAGHAFVVSETEYLPYLLKEEENEKKFNEIIHYYTKAFNFALRYFEDNDIKYEDIVREAKNPQGVKKLFDDKLDDDAEDLEMVLFAAQSLGSMVNLQKTNMVLVAQLPIAKEMFDWVCEKDPEINFGACDIFYATYEASRPATLGGNPEKGKKLFLETIKKRPTNYLARAAYIQYYLIPMLDEEGYKEQSFFLEKSLRNFEKYMKWSPIKGDESDFAVKRLGAYQMLALERFKIFKKLEKEIF